jgi:hypothetical protein
MTCSLGFIILLRGRYRELRHRKFQELHFAPKDLDLVANTEFDTKSLEQALTGVALPRKPHPWYLDLQGLGLNSGAPRSL